MPIFRQKLIWALVILSVLSAGGVIAASPANSPAPAASHAKKAAPRPPAPVMTPAMSPGPDCMTLIYNMTDCLTYVEHGSNVTKPDKNCCPELAGMLDSKPECLCNLLGNSSDSPVQLDLNRALKLPSICRLQAPSISLCSMIGIPVAAPGAAISAEAPSSTSGMSVAPSTTVEGPAGGKNGALALTSSCNNLPYLIPVLVLALLY